MAQIIHYEAAIVLSAVPVNAVTGLQANTLYRAQARDGEILYSSATGAAPATEAGYEAVRQYGTFHFFTDTPLHVRTRSGAGRLAIAEVTTGRAAVFKHGAPITLGVANVAADNGLAAGDWGFINTSAAVVAWASSDNAPADLTDWFLVPRGYRFSYCNDASPLTLWARAVAGNGAILPFQGVALPPL